MIIRNTAAISFFFIVLISQNANAQNLMRDYVKEYPVHYQPCDPWNRGAVFRNHIGHGGLFYNCDQEECKRSNPYITWNTQPYQCFPRRPIRTTINQQVCEVKQRILWGGSGCFSCETPACAQDCNQCGHCKSCQTCVNNVHAHHYHGQAYSSHLHNSAPAKQQPLLDRLAFRQSDNQVAQAQNIAVPVSQYNQPIAHQRLDYRQARLQQPASNADSRKNTVRIAQQPATHYQYDSGVEMQEKTQKNVLRELPKRGMKVIR